MEQTIKRIFLDTETTGLDPEKNGIIQIGALIEIDGVVAEEVNMRFQPFMNDEISEKALEVNGTTEMEIRGYPLLARVAYLKFVEDTLRKHVDQYVSKDKFMLCGYSCKFDDSFMRQWFIKNGDMFWGSYVKRQMLDLLPVMIFLRELGLINTEDVKLSTVCKLFNIEHEAHDAFSDAKATYELYGKLHDLIRPEWDEGVRWRKLNMDEYLEWVKRPADDL